MEKQEKLDIFPEADKSTEGLGPSADEQGHDEDLVEIFLD